MKCKRHAIEKSIRVTILRAYVRLNGSRKFAAPRKSLETQLQILRQIPELTIVCLVV